MDTEPREGSLKAAFETRDHIKWLVGAVTYYGSGEGSLQKEQPTQSPRDTHMRKDDPSRAVETSTFLTHAMVPDR